jgi:hypothetical protein
MTQCSDQKMKELMLLLLGEHEKLWAILKISTNINGA